MFDDMYFRSSRNEIIYLNTDPDPDGYFPVEELQFEREIRGSDRNRMQAQGTWPGFTYFGKMNIHINGHLLADSPAQLSLYKLRLMKIMMPNAAGAVKDRHAGWFYILFTGMTERFYTEVGIESAPDIMNAALNPSNVTCSLTFKSYLPYMIGVNSGKQFWVA